MYILAEQKLGTQGVQHLPDVSQLRGRRRRDCGSRLGYNCSSSTAMDGEGDQRQLLWHNSTTVGGEGIQEQLHLYSSAADAVKGVGGQGLRRGELASSGCVSQW